MYHYLENLARIEALRDDLKIVDAMGSAKIQNYDSQPGATGGHADDVSMRVVKIEMLESLILKAERWTKPITLLIRDLESPYSSPERQEMLEILRFKYLGGNTWDRIQENLKIRRETVFVRRGELVRLAMGYLALNL
jgi:hypothetical protein